MSLSSTQDRFVMVVGGLTVLVVLAGLAVVEANTGPFAHDVSEASHSASLEASYLVEDGSASSPLCSQQPTSEVCDPRTEMDVRIEGLPTLEDASYVALLAGEAGQRALDEFTPDGDAHRLRFEGEVDADAFDALLVGIAPAAEPTQIAFALHEQPLETSGGEEVHIEESLTLRLAKVEGSLDVAQIGAVEVAVTANAHIEGLPSQPGWGYHAWLADDDADVWTPLGSLDRSDEQTTGGGVDAHRLDVRVERVTLVEQDRFVVTLAPDVDGESEGLGGPQRGEGFPVVDVSLRTRSLLSSSQG